MCSNGLPKITNKPPRSKRGANVRYSAVLNAYKRAFDGGGSFGWDWPTLRSNWPEAYQYLQSLKTVYYNLPD
jgi:hypothetical protein